MHRLINVAYVVIRYTFQLANSMYVLRIIVTLHLVKIYWKKKNSNLFISENNTFTSWICLFALTVISPNSQGPKEIQLLLFTTCMKEVYNIFFRKIASSCFRSLQVGIFSVACRGKILVLPRN